MADIAKLKKKAADFEAKKQMDKALATYREMIEVYERGEEDPIDIPLYNRVGDLLQKAGNLAEAVSIWERAVDHYAEGGFYNPAIALCNKILRQSPGRTVVYYKLGKISAEKGFKADARQNFLEYASRMQKAGNLDEAFRALKEFADLVPDQDDVRLMLADQLVKAERKDEAIEQLQQIVALGTGRSSQTADGPMSDAARVEVLRLRSTMAEQAADHAEALARSEAEHQRVVEGERVRLRRVRLETAIRAEEMEYLLFQLDTAEQRIWEMSDAEGRAAARLAAGLAQLEKQKEQYEDLADELEVTRNLLVAAQAKIAELERLLDNERARLARVSLVPASTNLGEGSGSFEVNVDEPEDDDIEEVEASPEPEVEDFVAPRIQRDPNEPDRLAGINFDDDGPDQESLAVRLAGRSDDETGEVDLAGLGSAEVSGPRFHLPSDDLDIPEDDDDDDELAPAPALAPRVIVVPDEDDDDDEAFSIDTDWDEDETPAKPAGAPPEREPSNGRIVIEVLEDEAWPEDEGGESKG